MMLPLISWLSKVKPSLHSKNAKSHDPFLSDPNDDVSNKGVAACLSANSKAPSIPFQRYEDMQRAEMVKYINRHDLQSHRIGLSNIMSSSVP